jgi:protein SCO1/2
MEFARPLERNADYPHTTGRPHFQRRMRAPAIPPALNRTTKSSGPSNDFQMRGYVTGLDAAGHVATIKHEAIPGFMGAMTMGYPVKNATEFSKLAVGERITAIVYQNGDDFWIGNVQRK